ncbi:MAG: hypothetical protein KJ600_01995 [Nanoarchaeota archaeon]|nr:hypothetical protein [Nanoarchaeota archaeon]
MVKKMLMKNQKQKETCRMVDSCAWVKMFPPALKIITLHPCWIGRLDSDCLLILAELQDLTARKKW